MPSTAVLINTYNHAAYIEACLESVLAQVPAADEIIVYDDGSTDGNLDILRRYEDRIVLIAGERRPFPGSLNQAHAIYRAFQRSHADLVFLLDGDDTFLPGKIASHRDAYRENPGAALIQAPMMMIDAQGNVLRSNREPRRHVRDYLATTYRHHDTDLYYWTSALAFSRAYLQERLPVDMSLCPHLWIDARLAIVAPHFGPVITLEEPATGWRRHASSDSIRIRSRRLQLRNTLARAKVFNAFCRPRGWATISPWKSRRFYLQLLRYLMPDALYDVYYRRLRRRG